MKKIIRKRCDGKTTELIKLANGYNGVILVKDLNTAENVKKMAKQMKCEVVVQTYNDLIRNRIDRMYLQNKGIFIDDVDIFLADLLKGVKINAISLNDETEESKYQCEGKCNDYVEGKCENCMCKGHLF